MPRRALDYQPKPLQVGADISKPQSRRPDFGTATAAYSSMTKDIDTTPGKTAAGAAGAAIGGLVTGTTLAGSSVFAAAVPATATAAAIPAGALASMAPVAAAMPIAIPLIALGMYLFS